MPNLSWHKRAEGHSIKDGLDPRIRSGDESIISELALLGEHRSAMSSLILLGWSAGTTSADLLWGCTAGTTSAVLLWGCSAGTSSAELVFFFFGEVSWNNIS